MKALVTGGGGFLGGAIVRQLLHRKFDVRSFSRGRYAELDALDVEHAQGDLADPDAVREAVRGCDVVFHAAAKAGIWGRYHDYYEANVLGAKHVIEACQAEGVERLVYTSSPSVTFAGKDQDGIDESTPYPRRFLAHYPKTKAMAEKLVLSANGEGIHTVALRPHLIWGPGDTQLIPRLIERAKAGQLRIVGSGEQRVDAVYVDNAAEAHLNACDHLTPGSPCAGSPYYISNDEPWPIATLINTILECAGLPPVEKRVPAWLAYAAGAAAEVTYGALRKKEEPPMTRFMARQLATAHWYDITNAKRDLEYTPRITMQEGMKHLAESLRQGSQAA